MGAPAPAIRSPRARVHVGALDALAGLPFRVVAIPGLVEGGYPGRRSGPTRSCSTPSARRWPRAPAAAAPRRRRAPPRPRGSSRSSTTTRSRPPPAPAARAEPSPCPPRRTACSRARALFQRALGQATERLVLSYPRADARTGRERMPSLFFVAAAAALARAARCGAPTSRRWCARTTSTTLPLERRLDRSRARPRAACARGGREAALAIAAGSPFFKQSHLGARTRAGRASSRAYDGLVAAAARRRCARAARPVTRAAPDLGQPPRRASRAAASSTCWSTCCACEPAEEPEERRGLDPARARQPLPRGGRAVPARAARPRRAARARHAARRARACWSCARRARSTRWWRAARRASPLLWETRAARASQDLLRNWLAREADDADRAVPAHFEVGFGLRASRATGEPHLAEPLAIDLGDGRTLRVSGKIDRIDRARRTARSCCATTRRAARRATTAGVFRGGRQLQIPFYVLAAARIFPEAPVVRGLPRLRGRRAAGRVRPRRGARASRSGRSCATLVDAIADGRFVQEPTACDWCDFKAVCGPQPLLELRRRFKLGDPRAAARPAPAGRGDELRARRPGRRASARAATRATSLVLEAGAGTGKTTLLVDRIESLRAHGRRRARDRDRGRHLHRERGHHHEAAPARAAGAGARRRRAARRSERARAAAALDVLERAQVSTIHALCAAILQERPLECGVPPGFRVADEARGGRAVRRGLGRVAGGAPGRGRRRCWPRR